MFARLRRRLHLFLYSKCESYICKHNSHYAHLKQFLREESLSSALVGHLRGRRLEIQWVDDPDKGYAKQFIHVMSGDNPMFASGKSALFKNVVRITIKLKDVPGSNTDPLERMCLQSPKKKLN